MHLVKFKLQIKPKTKGNAKMTEALAVKWISTFFHFFAVVENFK